MFKWIKKICSDKNKSDDNSLKLNNDYELQFNFNAVSIVSVEYKRADSQTYTLFIEYIVKDAPEIVYEKKLDYKSEKILLKDKKDLLHF